MAAHHSTSVGYFPQLEQQAHHEDTRRHTYPMRTTPRVVQPIAVLFVDGHNQVRSILAQAQAELVRLWTVNRRGQQLFSCIDSAGLRISTQLTRQSGLSVTSSGSLPNRAAVDALLGGRTLSPEENDVRSRLTHAQTARGLMYEDFDQFDYIICFDRESLQELRNLQWIAHHRAVRHGRRGIRARTRLLGAYRLSGQPVEIFTPAVPSLVRQHGQVFSTTIRTIRSELYNFLQTKMAWDPPSRISPRSLVTTFRSRQFAVDGNRVTEAKIRMLKTLYSGVQVDDEIYGRRSRIVTITRQGWARLNEAYGDARIIFS